MSTKRQENKQKVWFRNYLNFTEISTERFIVISVENDSQGVASPFAGTFTTIEHEKPGRNAREKSIEPTFTPTVFALQANGVLSDTVAPSRRRIQCGFPL